eukprot:514766_1
MIAFKLLPNTRRCVIGALTVSKRLFSNETNGVYLYVDFPTSTTFDNIPWKVINSEMKEFNGLKSKTWLASVDNSTCGGFYEFDTKDNAQNYIDNYLKDKVEKQMNVKATFKLYDKEITKEASMGMSSPFVPKLQKK